MGRVVIQPKKYEYQPLKEGEVRILHLQPGELSDTVFVELSHERLDDNIQHYHALSWEWGESRPSEPIRIKDKTSTDPDVQTLKIKPNLCTALKHLRWSDKIRRLWVDAICIAQIEQIHDQNDAHRSSSIPQVIHPKLNGSPHSVTITAESHAHRSGPSEADVKVEIMKDDAMNSTNGVNGIHPTRFTSDREKNEEKANQISMMSSIFGKAHEVSVWLGDADEESARAINLIVKLAQLKAFDTIAELEKKNDDVKMAHDLEALIRFLKRGWFSRRWVVQEIALAQDAMVYCGNESVSWINVADAVALLEKLGSNGAINRILKRLPTTNHVPEYIGNFSSLPAYRLVQNTTGLFRNRASKQARAFKTWRYTLEELISFLAAFRASRTHDTIYAILGLASDFEPAYRAKNSQHEGGLKVYNSKPNPALRRRDSLRITDWSTEVHRFEVNYDEPVLSVFKTFLNHAIRKSKSLDILCRPWAPESGYDAKGNLEYIDLPSWIPSLSRKPFQAKRDGNMVRYNPDPLVGPAVFRHRLYCASGSHEPDIKIDLVNPDSKRITVKGFILDVIEDIWDAAAFGNVPASWLKAGLWEDVNENPPDELWRTLVADRNAGGNDPEPWWPLVFQSTAKERGLSYGFETYRLIHESSNSPVVEVFKRVQAVVWGRRLIRTRGDYMHWFSPGQSSNGALGLAPGEAKKGDLVCIISGCSVPLVLRKMELASVRPEHNDTSPARITNGAMHEEPEQMGGEPVPNHFPPKPTEDVYTLVGESYIDHMMDGEAVAYFRDMADQVDHEPLALQDFIIE